MTMGVVERRCVQERRGGGYAHEGNGGAVGLWRAYAEKRGVAERNALVEWYLPSIIPIAKKIKRGLHKRESLDDLISAGALGLIQAIERYDPLRGVKFRTFCDGRIRGAMLDALRRMDILPRQASVYVGRIVRAEELLRQRTERPVNAWDVAEELHMPVDEVCRWKRAGSARVMESLDVLLETQGPGMAGMADDMSRKIEVRDMVCAALNGVHSSGRERKVLRLKYWDEVKHEKIGEAVGLSSTSVNNVLKRMRMKMRWYFRKDKLCGDDVFKN